MKPNINEIVADEIKPINQIKISNRNLVNEEVRIENQLVPKTEYHSPKINIHTTSTPSSKMFKPLNIQSYATQ